MIEKIKDVFLAAEIHSIDDFIKSIQTDTFDNSLIVEFYKIHWWEPFSKKNWKAFESHIVKHSTFAKTVFQERRK